MTPGLWLGPASEEDAPALAALEARCHSHPWSEAQFLEELRHEPPHAALVLREAGQGPETGRGIAAYVVYRVVVDEMHILNVAVAPQRRRQGLARWLLAFSMARAARRGATRAFLEVRESNAPARALYEGLGFAELRTRADYYTEPREDGVVLGRQRLANSQP